MKNLNWKKVLPYLVALVIFVGFALVYCSPLLEGKVISAGDTYNWKGVAQESLAWKEATGETTWWTNSMFGGMPTYQISGSLPSGQVRRFLEDAFHLGLTDSYQPAGILVGYFLGFFIMLICFGVNPWVSIVGAIAMGLSSYFMLIIPAGHITKAVGLGFLAPMVGGFYAVFRRRYGLGFAVLTLYGIAGITLHPQMTYYVAMLIGVLAVAELFIHIREKRYKDLGIGVGVCLLSLLLIGGSKISWSAMNSSYMPHTMRGGHSELTQTETPNSTTVGSGLSLDYVTAWSYGVRETFTLLIPNYMGGCSGYDLGDDSQLEGDLKKMGVPAKQAKGFCHGAPTYWGEKAFTSGPVYAGTVICMLFVLGLIIVPGVYKWALLFATLASITLAWGRNFMPLTEFFYNYVPMYNKFRAVESILVIAEMTIPLLGLLAVERLLNSENRRYSKQVLIAGATTGAICLMVALFSGSMDVTSSYDAQWKGQVGDQIYSAILAQRHALITSSAWRSLLFVVLTTAVLWFFSIKTEMKHKKLTLSAVLLALVLIDMVPVDRHFFNERNFVSAKDDARHFAIQPWEEQILRDTDPDFRVYNMAANTFNDSRTSYRLKSIGGYHAAKLRRYQDLIDAHIAHNNWKVLDMLNTKYIITRDGKVHQNPGAMGHAWMVDEVQFVDTPDEECAALNTLDLSRVAVADRAFADALDVTKPEANLLMTFDEEYIRLTSYAPNHLEYDFQAEHNRIVVFSEIYYPKEWHLYVDGNEWPLGRVDYVLRAAVLPSGKHTVSMKFVPAALQLDRWSLLLTILAILLSLVLVTFPLWKSCKHSK